MRLTPLLLLILTLAAPLAVWAEPSAVVIVRHAEKADDGTKDPQLTPAGQARTEALARALGQAEIGGLIASQYRRTQQTLALLAETRNLKVTTVRAESGAIAAHVEAIASMVAGSQAQGLLVIAGHSNTVPLIVEALSGQVVPEIAESEYDRMFVLLRGEKGMQVIATRYGAPSPP